MEPSEEILKALDEIVDVNLEEVGKRRIGKRSSILKQPRHDDDQTEDLQKRKSLTSKRRVSFAEKFQVMELCTGNVYDIPGRSVSASDSTISGISKLAFEFETSDKNDAGTHVSRNEIRAAATEVVLAESGKKSSVPFPRKHKISPNENAEPESKKMNIEETKCSVTLEESNFKHEESLLSEFKKFLFGSTDIFNKEKDPNVEQTVMENTITNVSDMHKNLQKEYIREKLCDLTNSNILSQHELSDYIIPKSENIHENYKPVSITKHMENDYNLRNEFINGNKNSLNMKNQMNPKRWASRVEILPISLDEIPLQENKENIFVDLENKDVLLTNARGLKLKEKLPLRQSEVSKPFSFRPQTEKVNSLNESRILQDSENFIPLSIKEQNGVNKQKEKADVNKTCISDHPMELTYIPSNIDLTNDLEESITVDHDINDGYQSNKTHIDTSNFMDLTCHMQNLTHSTSFAINNECDEKKQFLTNVSTELAKKDEKDKNVHKTGNISKITYNAQNLSDNILISTEINKSKNLSAHFPEFINDKKVENIDSKDKCSQTRYFSSYGMELTCNFRNDINLNICNKATEHSEMRNEEIEQSQLVEISHSKNPENNFNKEVNQFKQPTENSFVHPYAKNMLNTDLILSESEKENSNSLHHHEKTKLMYDEMELTCYDENISSGDDDVFDPNKKYVSNINSKDAQTSHKEISKEDILCEIQQVNTDCNNSKSLILNSELQNLYNSSLISDINSKSLVYSKTQYFTSDNMELTSGSKFDDINSRKNASTKSLTKAKHFSSFGMDLTSISDIDSDIAKSQVWPQSEVLNEDNCFKMELTSGIKSDDINTKKNASTKSMTKTKHFSSFGMDLTCDSVSDIESDFAKNQIGLQSEALNEDGCSNMELTSGVKSDDINTKKNASTKNMTKTKHFSSFGMDLTCDSFSDIESDFAKSQIGPQSEVLNEESCSPKLKNLEFMYGSENINKACDQIDFTKEKKNSSVISKTGLNDNVQSKDISPVKHFSKTKYFSSIDMDLTCNVPSSSKNQGLLESEAHVNSSHSNDRILDLSKESSHDFNVAGKDIMKGLSEIGLNDFVKNKNITPVRNFSKTKHFSSIDMTLTCVRPSNVQRSFSENNMHIDNNNYSSRFINKIDSSTSKNTSITSSEKQFQNLHKSVILSNKYSFINNSDNCTSDFQKLTPRTCLVNDESSDPVQDFHKSKHSSSYRMKLTCDLQNKNDSHLEMVLNSSPDLTLDYECLHCNDNKSDIDSAGSNKCLESQRYGECEFETQLKSMKNISVNTNLPAVMADKKLDSKFDLTNKSNNNEFESNDNTDFQAQNVCAQDLQKSLETPKNQNVNSTVRTQSFKRSNVCSKDHEYEPDNKLVKISSSLEPDIVYAIKQVKGVNQALSDNCNIFKFPEIFFPLRKSLRPKTSFSCPKIQFTKAVREAIRKSHSFSYASNEWCPEISEKDISSKNKKSITPSKNPIKVNDEPALLSLKSSMYHDVPCSPKVLETWKSRTKTVTETVHVYSDIQFSENSPFPKTNMSVNKNGSLRKDNFSILNKSPDTMDYLRKSIDFDNEINCSKIIISHVHEESVVESSAVVTNMENPFPDNSRFCLDSSLTLVSNDTFDSEIPKKDSEIINDYNSLHYLNPSFEHPKTIFLKDVNALNSSNAVMNTHILESSKDILPAEVTEKSKSCDDAPQLALMTENNGSNEVCLTNINHSGLIRQNINPLVKVDTVVSNKGTKNGYVCNTESSGLLDDRTQTDKKNSFDLCVEKKKSSKIIECVKPQIEKSKESLEEHKQVSNQGLTQISSLTLNHSYEKEKSHSKQNYHETTKEIEMNAADVAKINNISKENININSNETFLEKNDEYKSKENITILTKPSKTSVTNENTDGSHFSNSSAFSKVNAKNICQNPFLEKSISKASNTLHNSEEQNVQSFSESYDVKQHSLSAVENRCFIDNTEKQKSSKCEIDTNKKDEEVLPLNPSADSTKQIATSHVLSKSPTKLNGNENIPSNSAVTLKEYSLKITDEGKFIDKDSNSDGSNIKDSITSYGNLEKSDVCSENPFEKIHLLRNEIIKASSRKDCLWCLEEMDDRQAIFEILGESLFACYLMGAELKFTSKIALCTKITCMHLKKEPDEIDELGFSLFQALVANDIKVLPFPAHELLNLLPKLVNFASAAKCLMKDVWLIAVRNEISIDLSSDLPKLNIKVLNKNHFSSFNVSLPISLTVYPNERITPEVTHLEYNLIKNELIIDAIKKINPGKNYLFRISEAVKSL